MKKLALIALIMVLGLSGCASSGTSGIKEEWTEFWNDPGAGVLGSIRQDWTEFWNDPGAGVLGSIRQEWTEFWN